jgi:SNF2 family DNA or RNA helicase
MHVLDQTWVPDDQEQLEDRIHRVSRIHNVTIYRYGSVGTIEQYIEKVNQDKSEVNKRILDLRAAGLRAVA